MRQVGTTRALFLVALREREKVVLAAQILRQQVTPTGLSPGLRLAIGQLLLGATVCQDSDKEPHHVPAVISRNGSPFASENHSSAHLGHVFSWGL